VDTNRKFLYETKVGLVDKENVVEVDLFLFTDLIMTVYNFEYKEIQQRILLDKSTRVKIAPNAKYFKNLVCLNASNKSLTFSCKTVAKRE
jgi:isocitrate/isopropylmalate dehydrogenase